MITARLLLSLLLMTPLTAQQGEPTSAAAVDPFLSLEQVDSADSLAWVRERNQRSAAALTDSPDFKELQERLLSIYTANDRLTGVSYRGGMLYNFWRDGDHPHGIWRRCGWDAWFEARGDQRQIEWETLLDVDALNAAEGENFVFGGADVLRPGNRRALISLSRGGADADLEREFDLQTLDWVADDQQPFLRPESKGDCSWLDEDTLLVAADFGPGTTTSSGYPRSVRLWHRGQDLDQAETIYEVAETDMSCSAWRQHQPGYERTYVSRTIDFQNSELFLRDAQSGALSKIEVPDSADKFVWQDWLFISPRFDWQLNGSSYPAGALLVTPLPAWQEGERQVTTLFAPAANQSLDNFEFTANHLILTVLEDVRSRLLVLTPPAQLSLEPWSQSEQSGLPEFGSISVRAVDSWERDDLWLTVTDFLTPTTQMYGQLGESPIELRSQPEYFNAEGLATRQFFATSEDGTQIPYFVIGPEELPTDGSAPTILYGYGGFEISLTPGYRASVGAAWLERGGVYVVANIRGGGEYGRAWHQAALQGERHKAYEDFAAVARDLVCRGITTAQHLGCQGGSNGGLLVGNMYSSYPELFGAVLCEVPLLDMLRYTQLPPGASWISEYGDPAIPEQAEYLRRYSPYHNLDEEHEYPPILITTSTRDDRVHPGHARKFAARIEQLGNPVLYYENIEGGHGGATTPAQSAYLDALGYEFLWQSLSPNDSNEQ